MGKKTGEVIASKEAEGVKGSREMEEEGKKWREKQVTRSIPTNQSSIKDRKLQINFVEGPVNLNILREHTLFL